MIPVNIAIPLFSSDIRFQSRHPARTAVPSLYPDTARRRMNSCPRTRRPGSASFVPPIIFGATKNKAFATPAPRPKTRPRVSRRFPAEHPTVRARRQKPLRRKCDVHALPRIGRRRSRNLDAPALSSALRRTSPGPPIAFRRYYQRSRSGVHERSDQGSASLLSITTRKGSCDRSRWGQARRQFAGSSARTVPTPTMSASARSRRRCDVSCRASGPVIQRASPVSQGDLAVQRHRRSCA